jgi:hypothetical protein
VLTLDSSHWFLRQLNLPYYPRRHSWPVENIPQNFREEASNVGSFLAYSFTINGEDRLRVLQQEPFRLWHPQD